MLVRVREASGSAGHVWHSIGRGMGFGYPSRLYPTLPQRFDLLGLPSSAICPLLIQTLDLWVYQWGGDGWKERF